MGEIKEGLHPRDVMESTLVRARAYAQNFNSESGNLLLVGGTGLGKTHLSAAIAEVIINKGYTVIYETAQKLVNDIRQNQFGETDIDIDKYRQCDLLIIDDLGTEVKTEYNISIINEIINNRIVNNKSMIISTNLDNKKINEIYSARIYSRLLGEFKPLMFLGKDIRLIKKTL